ncbi:MAG: zinc ribbon domain-containing protein [Romboutsia sp.]
MQDKIENIKEEAKMQYINDEIKKTKALLSMGILIYEKIRKNEINDDSFNELCNEILELDKVIYESNNKIDKLEDNKHKIFCECGHIANENDKFCVECGTSIQIEKNEDVFRVCSYCSSDMYLDFNYCTCCGNKL